MSFKGRVYDLIDEIAWIFLDDDIILKAKKNEVLDPLERINIRMLRDTVAIHLDGDKGKNLRWASRFVMDYICNKEEGVVPDYLNEKPPEITFINN
jgi:uncharacterized protein YabE (DUF348 family)